MGIFSYRGNSHISANGSIQMGDFRGLSQNVYIFSSLDDYSGRFLTNQTVLRE